MLQVLYKLKTAKVFEKKKQARSLDGDEEPFAIQMVKLCQESRLLAVAGASGHVILYRFSRLEVTTELSVSTCYAGMIRPSKNRNMFSVPACFLFRGGVLFFLFLHFSFIFTFFFYILFL